MAKRYQIDLIVNASQADGVAPKLKAGFKEAEGAIAGSGNAIEKTVQKIDVGLHNLQLSGVKAMDAIAKAAEKSASDAAKAQEKSIQSQMVGLDSLRMSGVKAMDQLRASQEKAAKAAEKTAQDQAKAQQKSIESQMVGLDQLRMSGIKAMDKLREEQDKAIAQAKEHELTLEDLSLGYMALSAGIGVVEKLGEAWLDTQKSIDAAATASLDFNNSLRELATLKGQTLNEATPEQISMYAKTGLNRSQINDFQRQFEGSLPAGMQNKNITRETANDLAVEAARMAARQGANASMRGDLAGILSQFSKINTKEEGLGQLESIRLGLTEGRGDDAPLMKQLLSVSGSLVGENNMVGTLPEMAALIGVQSLSGGPNKAGARTQQLYAALSGSTDKQRNFLSEFAGIGANDNMEGRLDKIVPKLKAMQSQGTNIRDFLAVNGMNQEQSRALTESVGTYDIFKQRMAKARLGANGADVVKANNAFDQTPEGQRLLGKNWNELAPIVRGARYREASNVVLNQDTLDQLNGGKDTMYGKVSDMMMPGGREARLRVEALRGLQSQARAYQASSGTTDAIPTTYNSSMDSIQSLVEYLKSHGQTPNASKEIVEAIDRQTAKVYPPSPPVLGAPLVGKGR